MTAITYTRQGDYNLPNLTMPDQPMTELGLYAQMRKRFLKENHRILYFNLLTSVKLKQHLANIEQRALQMEENLIRQMAQQQDVSEKLKAEDPMKWTRMMNNIRQSARETVMNEVIYTL